MITKEHVCIPWLWPACAISMAQSEPLSIGEHLIEDQLQLSANILKFAKEAQKAW